MSHVSKFLCNMKLLEKSWNQYCYKGQIYKYGNKLLRVHYDVIHSVDWFIYFAIEFWWFGLDCLCLFWDWDWFLLFFFLFPIHTFVNCGLMNLATFMGGLKNLSNSYWPNTFFPMYSTPFQFFLVCSVPSICLISYLYFNFHSSWVLKCS